MKQSDFISMHNDYWQQAESELRTKTHAVTLPDIYRTLSQHLSIARTREYNPELIGYLQNLVLDYHCNIYSRKNNWLLSVWQFYQLTFPKSVRKHSSIVITAGLLFFIPLIFAASVIYFYPDSAYYVLSFEQLADIKDMYNPDNKTIGRQRPEDGDWYMFGFYLYNNTSIGFRTFAAGLLLGLGAGFMLLFNAIFIGVVAGYLINLGYSETFFSFVSGHSSFELLAIVLSGAAGFIIGNAMINPGNMYRKKALQLAARDAMPLMQGAMSFFFIAALIEAFWSSSIVIPLMIKLTAGVLLWITLIGYLFFTGSKRIISGKEAT